MWYSQNDPKWKGVELGKGPDTIGADGCLLTSGANLGHYCAGGNTDPLGLNGFLLKLGRFVNNELLPDKFMDGLFDCHYVDVRYTPNRLTAADYNWLQDAPSEQYIIEIDADAHEAGVQPHFVLYYDGHSAATIRVVDSWDGKVKLLSAYGNPSVIIQRLIHYRIVHPTKQAPTPAPKAPTAPKPVETPPAPQPAKDSTPAPTTPPAAPQAPQNATDEAAAVTRVQLTWLGKAVQWLIDKLMNLLPR